MPRVELKIMLPKDVANGMRNLHEAKKVVAKLVDPPIALQRHIENVGITYIGMKHLVRKKAA